MGRLKLSSLSWQMYDAEMLSFWYCRVLAVAVAGPDSARGMLWFLQSIPRQTHLPRFQRH
jgi:hypothetical protein